MLTRHLPAVGRGAPRATAPRQSGLSPLASLSPRASLASRGAWARVPTGLALAVVATVVSPAIRADAHETGAIRVAAKEVPIGGRIDVTGEKLPKHESLTLQLRGILDNYDVGRVTTDTAGRFAAQLPVPPAAPAGTYTLVAIASDGDVTARADLVVTPAGTTTAAGGAAGAAGDTGSSAAAGGGASTGGGHDMAGMPGMSGMTGPHATAEPMVIASTTTPAQWAIIWALIVASVVAGIALIRRAPTSHHARGGPATDSR